MAKAEIVQQIRKIIQRRGITQTEAAEILGLDQPKVSALIRGRTDGYSLDRLFRFLNSLGQQIEICIRAVKSPNANSAKSQILVTPELG